jgi:hypothetical protein
VEAYWDGVLRFQSKNAVADGKWHNIVAVYYAGAADFLYRWSDRIFHV